MSEALSFELDLLRDLSWLRVVIVAVSLSIAYGVERRAWARMLTMAWLVSQIGEAALLCLTTRGASFEVTAWWVAFGAVPYVLARPPLRRWVISAPRQATMVLPRLVARIQTRRAPPADGTLTNRQALDLLRAEGWRPGWVQHTVTDADGRTHTVWAPPQRLPLGMRLHGWLAFAPTAALAALVVYLIWQLPPWARPVAEVGVGIGVLGHLGLLPNPLRLFGL